MNRKNTHVYESESGDLAFFPSAPLVKLGWILKPENAMVNANKARDFGQFIGLPLVLMLFLFITRYLNVVHGVVLSILLLLSLFALLLLTMYIISQGTVSYRKSVHGALMAH